MKAAMNLWIFFSVFLRLIGCYLCEVCHPALLKHCLQPSLVYLQNVSTIYGKPAGVLQATITHYFKTHYQENKYHIGSFKTVMIQLDEVFYHQSKLDQGCKFFTRSENCLLVKKQWCDQEVRDVLEGIENLFNFICHQKYMKVFKENQGCILQEDVTNARFACNHDLVEALNTLGETVTKYPEKSPQIEDGENSSTLCKATRDALSCYKKSIRRVCGEKTAEWEYSLRHVLVQLLLSNVCGQQDDYEYVEALTNEECFVCKDGEDCLPSDLKCDGVQHCADGSDESSTFCSQHWGVLDTVLLAVAVGIILTVIIVCIVKHRENIKYSLKHRLLGRTTEMTVFINERDHEDGAGRESEPAPSTSPNSFQNRHHGPFEYEQLTYTGDRDDGERYYEDEEDDHGL